MTRRRRNRRSGLAVAAGGVALLGVAGLAFELLAGAGGAPHAAAVGGAFRLVSGDGRIVTDRSFPGRWMLMFFGYTECPDECPLALASVADAMGRLGARSAEVQPVFVTIDPEHDTQAVVRRYVSRFDRRLVGLTGSAAEIRAVAARYDVGVGREADGRIDHGAVLFLMDPDGRLAAAIPADASGAEIARDVRAALGSA